MRRPRPRYFSEGARLVVSYALTGLALAIIVAGTVQALTQ